jgi:hypothetical protein
MRRARVRPVRRRVGVALVAALGLLMLAAALLAGSAVGSVELRRATRSLTAAALAESEMTRGLGAAMQGWDTELDSLPIGAVLERAPLRTTLDGPPILVLTRVRRLTSSLYAASVSVRVGADGAELAFRHARLLLERSADTTIAGTSTGVALLARWSVVDLH